MIAPSSNFTKSPFEKPWVVVVVTSKTPVAAVNVVPAPALTAVGAVNPWLDNVRVTIPTFPSYIAPYGVCVVALPKTLIELGFARTNWWIAGL